MYLHGYIRACKYEPSFGHSAAVTSDKSCVLIIQVMSLCEYVTLRHGWKVDVGVQFGMLFGCISNEV